MSERFAVCMPLGLGLRGAPVTVRYDGVSYRCAPFRVQMGGARVIDRGGSSYSLVDHRYLREVRVRLDHPLGESFRDLITRPEAESLLAVLETPSPTALQAGGAFARAAEVCASRDPAPICALLSDAAALKDGLSFGEWSAIFALARVIVAELAIVLDRPPDELVEGLRERREGFWRRMPPFAV